MQFDTFSKKQLAVLSWWADGSPVKDYDGIICDGSVRAGKTVAMGLSFVMWAMANHRNRQFGMSGRSVGAFERNVIFWLTDALQGRGYNVRYIDSCLIVRNGDIVNHFYVFGGKDKTSYTTIQGLTAAGWFFDEVALQPENFVNQALARCSVENSKIWYNCNPDSPFHWFKTDYIDKAKEKRFLHLHFLMTDNLTLSKSVLESYERRYTGVFYKRYILGLWVMAEGVIYDNFSEAHTYNLPLDKERVLYADRFLAIDYGITNPFAVLEIIDEWDNIYIDNMIYYDSAREGKQLTDEQYMQMIKSMEESRGVGYNEIIIDPSASSMIQLLRLNGYLVTPADNDVLEGIKVTHSAFHQGKIHINEPACGPLIKELHTYAWDEQSKEKGNEKPIKVNDHACDALRYYCNTKMRMRVLGGM